MIEYGFEIKVKDGASSVLNSLEATLLKMENSFKRINKINIGSATGGMGASGGIFNPNNISSKLNSVVNIPSLNKASLVIRKIKDDTNGIKNRKITIDVDQSAFLKKMGKLHSTVSAKKASIAIDMNGLMSGLRVPSPNLLLASFAGYSAFSGVKKVLGIGSQIDLYKKSIGYYVNDKEKSESLNKTLEIAAKTTSLTTSDAFKYGKLLLGAGVKESEVASKLKLANSIATVSGVSNENKEHFFVNFLQGYTKRNLDTRDVKQYGSYGVQVFKDLYTFLKKTEGMKKHRDLDTLITKGMIGGRLMEEFFKSQLAKGGRYDGVEAKMLETVSGKWTLLESKVQDKMVKIFESSEGGIMKIVKGLTGFVDNIDLLIPSIKALADPFIGLSDRMLSFAKSVGLVDESSNGLMGGLKAFLSLSKELLDIYLKFVLPLQIVGSVFATLVSAFTTIGAVLKGVGVGAAFLGGVTGAVGTGAALGGVAATASVLGGLTPIVLGGIVTSVIAILAGTAYGFFSKASSGSEENKDKLVLRPDNKWYHEKTEYSKSPRFSPGRSFDNMEDFSFDSKRVSREVMGFKFLDKFIPTPSVSSVLDKDIYDDKINKDSLFEKERGNGNENDRFGISGIGSKNGILKIEIENALKIEIQNMHIASKEEGNSVMSDWSKMAADQILSASELIGR